MKKIVVVLVVVIFNIVNFTWAESSKKFIDKDIIVTDGNFSVHQEELKQFIGSLSLPLKKRLINNQKDLEDSIVKLLKQKRILKEAILQGLLDDPEVSYSINSKKNRILVDQYLHNLGKKIKIPNTLEDLAHEYYTVHSKEFLIEKQINVAHILFSFNKKDKKTRDFKLLLAKEVLKKLKDGENFATLASTYTDDNATADNGGDLGFFKRGVMTKKFDKEAFSLNKIGQISNIVETPFGFHIIKLLATKKSGKKTFESVKQKLVARERKKYIKNNLQKKLAKLDSSENITLNMPSIEKLIRDLKEKYKVDQ